MGALYRPGCFCLRGYGHRYPRTLSSKKATDPIGIIFDEEVTRGEYEYAYRGVYLLYVLATGSEPRLDEQTDTLLQESAWQRLAILKKANQLGFSISDEQLVRGIQSLPHSSAIPKTGSLMRNNTLILSAAFYLVLASMLNSLSKAMRKTYSLKKSHAPSAVALKSMKMRFYKPIVI